MNTLPGIQRSKVALAAAWLALAVACLVLIGWAFDVRCLKSIYSGYTMMKPVTALSFLFSAVALLLLLPKKGEQTVTQNRRRWSQVLAVTVSLIGMAVLTEHFSGKDLGFDQLLFHQSIQDPHLTHPGRISPASAWNSLLIGVALLLLDKRSRWGFYPSQGLSLILLWMGFIAVQGYTYGVQELGRAVPFASVSLPAAILFILMGFGIFFARPDWGLAHVITSHNAGGWMARRILPITTSLPFVIAWLRTHGERAGLYEHQLGLAIFSSAYTAILAMIIWFNARSLNQIDTKRKQTREQVQRAMAELNRVNTSLQIEITQRKKAEDLLRLSNDSLEDRIIERTAKLEDANKELEAFSYSVSHDLRGPLRSINGFSKMLMDAASDRLNEEEQTYIQRVYANSNRMGRLIDDLLKLSHVSRSAMRRTDVDLSAMAEEIMDNLKQIDPERKTEVSIQPGMQVRGDEGLLHAVLENLLGNAWKFTRKSTQAKIGFASAHRDDETVFIVSDNGAGFDMNYANKLFGAFQRLHGPEDFEGNGIGLATVQRILRRHNGRIWAEGVLNSGAKFSFTIGKETP